MQKRSVQTAPASWSDHAGVARMGHRGYFEQFGFTVIQGLLSPSQLGRVSAEIERIAARNSEFPNVRIIGRRDPRLPPWDLEDTPPLPVAHKITGIRALSPLLAKLLVEPPALLEVLHALLGNRVELCGDALIMQAAQIGQEPAWHQDAVLWPFRPMHLTSAMIALDAADPDNGCLQVVPGSHHGLLPHEKTQAELRLDLGDRASLARHIPMAPGDCLIIHSLLLRATGHNATERLRRASICTYSPGHPHALDPRHASPILISEKALSA